MPIHGQNAGVLDPASIPRWVNQLDDPPAVFVPTNITDSNGKLVRQEYAIKVSQFSQQMLPTTDAGGNPTGFAATTVWGYEGQAKNVATSQDLGVVKSSPGSTFEAVQGVPIQIKWINSLIDANGNPLPHLFPVDPTIHWANPKNLPMSNASSLPAFPSGDTEAQSPVPIVMHLHGGEDPSASDGNPQAWWTADGLHGSAYATYASTDANAAVYFYPNEQQPTTLWYHDHTLGMTTINVMAGLVGFYLVGNSSDPVEQAMPSGAYDVPLCIQDKTFLANGSLYYPTNGTSSEHPYWNNFFLGNTITVNGKVWPNLDVAQGIYRFRLLDASASRFYNISFSNNMSFKVIGTDGGFLKAPLEVTSLTIAPAERYDVLVDFSKVPSGEKLVMKNIFSVEPENLTGEVMQFTVTAQKGEAPKALPSALNPTLAGAYPTLSNPIKQRILTLISVGDPLNPSAMLLDGQPWDAPVSENPQLGSTEDWVLVNPTIDSHPIHIHLVQFQVVQHQAFNVSGYMAEWTALNGPPPLNHSTVNVGALDSYFIGSPTQPTPTEQGWKDTITVNPGEMVTIRLRFARQDGGNFGFDATAGAGYVWHCHLLPHEDNEMMRPYVVVAANQNVPVLLILVIAAVIVTAVLLLFIAYRLRHRKRA